MARGQSAASTADAEAARGRRMCGERGDRGDLRGGAEAAVARHGGGVEELRGHGGRSGAM